AATASNSSCSDSCSTSASRSSVSSSTIRILRTLDIDELRPRRGSPTGRRWAAIEHEGGKEQVVDAVEIASFSWKSRYNWLMEHSTLAPCRVRGRAACRTQTRLTAGPPAVRVALSD